MAGAPYAYPRLETTTNWESNEMTSARGKYSLLSEFVVVFPKALS